MVSIKKIVFALALAGDAVAWPWSSGDDTNRAKRLEVEKTVKMVQSLREAKAAGTDITALVDEMLVMVRSDIIDQIKTHHASTQSELNTKVNAAISATGLAGAEKQVADGAFFDMNTCYSQEKAQLVVHETEVSETAAAVTASNSAETAADNAAPITSDGVSATDVVCNALVDVDCAQAKADLTSTLDSKKQAFDSDVQGKIDNYNNKNQTWTAALAALATQIQEEQTADTEYRTERTRCDSASGASATAVCVYSDKEKVACDEQSNYADLVGQVESTGNVFSNPDREQEYNTSAQVECLLEQLKDESKTCDGPFLLLSEVSQLSYQQPATAYTACVQTDITFSATTWNRPVLNADASFPPSSAYGEISTIPASLDTLLSDCESDDDKE